MVVAERSHAATDPSARRMPTASGQLADRQGSIRVERGAVVVVGYEVVVDNLTCTELV